MSLMTHRKCGVRQMLRNLIEVLKLLNGARPSASSAGLELLLAARSTEDVTSQLPPKIVTHSYVRHEADAAWDCLQARLHPMFLIWKGC